MDYDQHNLGCPDSNLYFGRTTSRVTRTRPDHEDTHPSSSPADLHTNVPTPRRTTRSTRSILANTLPRNEHPTRRTSCFRTVPLRPTRTPRGLSVSERTCRGSTCFVLPWSPALATSLALLWQRFFPPCPFGARSGTVGVSNWHRKGPAHTRISPVLYAGEEGRSRSGKRSFCWGFRQMSTFPQFWASSLARS